MNFNEARMRSTALSLPTASGHSLPLDTAAARRVLRNTYVLLGLNLGFGALAAGATAAFALPAPLPATAF